jgi:hypothetical protein
LDACEPGLGGGHTQGIGLISHTCRRFITPSLEIGANCIQSIQMYSFFSVYYYFGILLSNLILLDSLESSKI